MQRPKILVTGASGFVARNLRRHLSENGYPMVSVSRSNFRAFKDEHKAISDYGRSLYGEMRGSDVLVHLVGVGRQDAGSSYEDVNVRLTKDIVDLCGRAGIKRIVYLSGLGASSKSTIGYFISKYAAERLIADSGLDYTIFRPSYIVGRDDLLTKLLRRSISKGSVIIPGSGGYSIQPVHIGDVVRVIERSLTGSRFVGKTVDLVGPELFSFEEYVRLFIGGTDTRIQRIDMEEALRLAVTGRAVYDVDALSILAGNFVGNHRRISRLAEMKFGLVSELLKTGATPQ